MRSQISNSFHHISVIFSEHFSDSSIFIFLVAPIESFFHILKTECLNGFPQCKDIGEFKEITKNYIDWFNNRRISQKTKGMTPCEYREHALAV
nr:IS3 family transposase [Fructilactobacillus sanfranciscensis]